MEMGAMFSLRACAAVGVVGLLLCSVLVGVSFSSIQVILFQLNLDALVKSVSFYSFITSFAGFAGSIALIVKKPSTTSKSDGGSSISHKPSQSSVKVDSSGTSGFVTLLPGTKLQNESGTTMELAEPYIMWPKFAKSEVPEEPKKGISKRRFFERVAE
jgi:hypothetical protein